MHDFTKNLLDISFGLSAIYSLLVSGEVLFSPYVNFDFNSVFFFRNAILTITVTDVNDNPPEFNTSPDGNSYYTFQIYEVRNFSYIVF